MKARPETAIDCLDCEGTGREAHVVLDQDAIHPWTISPPEYEYEEPCETCEGWGWLDEWTCSNCDETHKTDEQVPPDPKHLSCQACEDAYANAEFDRQWAQENDLSEFLRFLLTAAAKGDVRWLRI